MELFSEINSAYYRAVAKILKYDNISEKDAVKIIKENAFNESDFFIMPKVKDSKTWRFISYENNRLKSVIKNKPLLPLTTVEKGWIKSIIEDEKAVLFLDNEEIEFLREKLKGSEKLYDIKNYKYFDRHKNGDNFSDENYVKIFRTILKAINENRLVRIEYKSAWGSRINQFYIPLKFQFSPVNNRMRVFAIQTKHYKLHKVRILNLSRIQKVEILDINIKSNLTDDKIFKELRCDRPVKLKIYPERNGVERFMMEFASYEKNTELDEETGVCTATLYYDKSDEPELLIKFLGFGPVIKVEAPDEFVRQIEERVKKQLEFCSNFESE